MIVVFQSIYLIFKYWFRTFVSRNFVIEINASVVEENESEDLEFHLQFDPPVYKQRYGAVELAMKEHFSESTMKKIVDFGCAEFGLFLFTKRLCKIEEILEVDIDEQLLRDNLFKLYPLTVDYINRRLTPLKVHILCGSISDPDDHLTGTDVVIGIEIIEHLYPDTLDALPYNVFEFIKPRMAVFTTPNADFNVLFPNFKGIRHYDHKFEWTRSQFQEWAINITQRFPSYTVLFQGVGKGPPGTDHLGYCSQMAVFIRNIENNLDVDTCTCIPLESFGVCCAFKDKISLIKDKQEADYYKSVEIIDYPYDEDSRSSEEKILDELKYRIMLLGSINGRCFNDDNNRCEIPLQELLYGHYNSIATAEESKKILEKYDYIIEECLVYGELQPCIIYEPLEMDRSSTPSDLSNHSRDSDKEHWSAASTDGESSNWEIDVNADLSINPWVDENDLKETAENIYEIVNDLVVNCIETSDTSTSVNMYDSGYYKSNTTLTTSTQSGSDFLEGDPLEEIPNCNFKDFDKDQTQQSFTTADGSSFSHNEKFLLKHKPSNVKSNNPSCTEVEDIYTIKTCEMDTFSKNYKNSKVDFVAETVAIENVEPKTEASCLEIYNPVNGFCHESVASCSSKKRKKCNGSKKEHIDQDVLIHEERNVPDVFFIPPVVQVVVENGDLANNNRDVEGNNYPNAPQNVNNGGNDNEDVVLQNVVQLEDQRNEEQRDNHEVNEIPQMEVLDERNDVEQAEEQSIIAASIDTHVNDVEVEFASREALFDPNSEIDLLDDFSNSAIPQSADAVLTGIEINQDHLGVLLVHINAPDIDDISQAVLPIGADPFPNWLLHLLGAEVLEEGEPHDEPHFYCQGDGIGVHPSFIEDDFDDDHTSSSSDTSSTASTDDEAEAEPTVSEVEAVSLPDDTVVELEATEPPIASVSAGESTANPSFMSAGGSTATNSTVEEFYDTREENSVINNVPTNGIHKK